MFRKKTKTFTTQEIAFLSLLTAACVVGRLMFQFIPNVQPMTVLFLIVTLQYGISRGLIVNVLSLLITNFYLGMGVWTISQILSFSVIILLFGLLTHISLFKRAVGLQVFYSLLAGYLYGFLMAIIDTQIYGLTNFWVYYFAGISFDTLHAVGNAGFYLILYPIFKRLFQAESLEKA
ncbi:ECF transporter S component [Enterococcus sp. LJL98]